MGEPNASVPIIPNIGAMWIPGQKPTYRLSEKNMTALQNERSPLSNERHFDPCDIVNYSRDTILSTSEMHPTCIV
jgi:hypothetical protein